jgi:enediyne biosynthesis protein E3
LGNGWRALRRKILTPDVSETSIEKRGFHRKSPAAQELLETVGKMFLTGYGYAMEARTVTDAENRLEELPIRFKGFAYEGAGMAYTMLDQIPMGRRGHIDEFLAGRGDKHNYMIYVGIGWAMARLPRFLWPKPESVDPLLRWLVLDGYGFHQAYFRTEQYVANHHVDPYFPWPGGATGAYANNAIDQGIGRALWFVGGTDAATVANLIDGYAPERHPDLWAGAGLAATYAGGGDPAELAMFADRAGQHRPLLAQGSAFAAEARIRADLLVPHIDGATQVLCGLDPVDAAQVCARTRPDRPDEGGVPAYEVWRHRIAAELVSIGGVST